MAKRIALLSILGATYLGLANPLQTFELSAPAAVALAILVVAATLWITELIPLFLTSLLVLFLSLTWLAPIARDAEIPADNSLYLAPFFSDIVLLFLGGFVLSAGMHQQRLDQWLAARVIALTHGSIPRLLMGVMVVTAFLSMWLSNTATTAMMLALVIPMVDKLAKQDACRKALVLAIPFAANIGGLGTPIGSPPNAVAMEYLTRHGIGPSFFTWMLIGIPGVVGMLLIAWGLLVVMYRGKASNIALKADSIRLRWDRKLIVVLITVGLTATGWITSEWHGYSSGTVAMIPILILFGSGILQVQDLKSLSWDVLLLMGGGLCLGVAISSSGLAVWLTDRLPLDGLGVYGITVVFGVTACFMSSVMSNTATANLLMPILLGMQVEPISPLLIGVAFACSMAMPLPVSTPPNAMAFASKQLTVKDMVRPGLVITVLGLILAFTIGYAWWGLIGLGDKP